MPSIAKPRFFKTAKPIGTDQSQARPARGASMLEALRTEFLPDANEAPLTLEKIRLAQANMEPGMKLMPVISLVCALAFLKWHPVETIALWYGFFLAAWAVRMRVSSWLPHVEPDRDSVRRAARLYFLNMLLFVVAWASQAVVFWVPGDPVNHVILVAILLSGSMSSTLTAAWWPAPFTQISIYLGTAALMFLSEGTSTALALCVVSVLFGRFLMVSTRNLHGAAQKMLKLESEKDVLIAELRASDRAKNEFLANMSHELRTPLNAILGFSELISTQMLGPVGTPKYRDYAEDIHVSGKHLLLLINDILDHAKIQSGHFVPEEEVVELNAVAEETLRFFRLKAESGQIKLAADIEGILAVTVDRRGLKQALTNLLSNAIKFTPPGGTVRLGARRTATGETHIWVADTGCGISLSDQKTIFKSFGQGRHDVAIQEKGTGLGLSIVKGILEAHGGTVRVESAPGAGATFTVMLPSRRAVTPFQRVA